MPSDVWTIVLAAGAGRRLASRTGGAPKQFWRPGGGQPSLLETTLARLYGVNVPERTLTVVDATHRPYVQSHLNTISPGPVLYQPMDRGTAVGVLLPLVAVLAHSPEAMVIVTPSDHGFDDEEHFRVGIMRAITRIREGLTDVVLFGVEPSAVSADYGWITPSSAPVDRQDFRLLEGFVEKPPLLEAFQLFASGAVWNTMVLVAKGRALLRHFQTHLPFQTDVLTTAMTLDAGARDAFLLEWYPELPRADFSRDLLTLSRPLSLYTWPADVGWSDLGTPERLEEWLTFRSVADGDDLVPA